MGAVRQGDAALMAAALLGAINGVCGQYIKKPSGIAQKEVAELLTQITFSGIAQGD